MSAAAREKGWKAEADARREQVDAFDCAGLRPVEILKRLQDKGFLSQAKAPLKTVRQDLARLRKRRRELIYDGLSEQTRADFIGQQREILAGAMRKGDYRAVGEASKNIAKARGIDMDKLTIEGNVEHAIRRIVVVSPEEDG